MEIPHVVNRFFGLFFTDDSETLPAATSPTLSPTAASAATAFAATPPATPITVPIATPTAVNTPIMTGSLEMKIGSFNVKNTPDIPRASVVKCGEIAGRQGAGIIGFQEIGQEDHQPLADGLGKHYRMLHPNIQIPIAYDIRKFACLSSGSQLMHEGLAGASPNRYISWGRFKSLQNVGMPAFIVMNTHMAVQKDNALKAQKWRIQMWEKHLRAMQQKVGEWSNELVFVVGDFNPDHRPVNLPGVKWVVTHDPDRIGVKAPATIKAAFVNYDKVPSPSDHAGLVARFMVRGNR